VTWLNLALGHEAIETGLATFVRNPAFPSIHDANFVYDVTASTDEAIERLLERARIEYADCETVTFRLGPDAPPALEARLGVDAIERNRTLVMLLEDELEGVPPVHELMPIEDEAGWAALSDLKRADWRENAAKMGCDPNRMEIPDALAATSRLKSPAVRHFLALGGGRPVGCFNSWSGVDGVGQVEDLFVLPEWRHLGVATALIHRCVADARARGAGPIVICTDLSDTPKTLYRRMGWRPLAVCRQYGMAPTSTDRREHPGSE
jgi:GNAT superfamily N-acetyltransferase